MCRLFAALVTTLLVGACLGTAGPGSADYPFNVSGVYVGTLTLEGEDHPTTVEMETRSDGTVSGSIRSGDPLRARGDFSGTLRADTLVWRSAYRLPSRGCSGVARGVGPVARGGGAIHGSVRVEDSCRGTLRGRFEWSREGDAGRRPFPFSSARSNAILTVGEEAPSFSSPPSRLP